MFIHKNSTYSDASIKNFAMISDAAIKHNAELIQCRLPVPDRHCSYLRDIVQSQVQHFEHRFVAMERPPVIDHFLALLLRYKVQTMPHQMDDAELHLRLVKSRLDGFRKSFQSIHAVMSISLTRRFFNSVRTESQNLAPAVSAPLR